MKIKKNKMLYVIGCMILLLILLYTIRLKNGINDSVSYEITDYVENNLINILEERVDQISHIALYYENECLREITLEKGEGESSLWSLYGLRPGMNLETVLQLLEGDGIVLERHNMQWYASGIELERKGIERLSWDPNSQITYVSALLNSEKMKKTQKYEWAISSKKYVAADTEKKTDIVVSYPYVSMDNQDHIADNINKNIEEAVNRLLQNNEIGEKNGVSVNVDYTIQNIESDCFSVTWEGTVSRQGSTETIRTAFTCDMLENGECLKVTDIGFSEEEIAGEIAWMVDMDEELVQEQLKDNYYEFYVTPLRLVVIMSNGKTGEIYESSMWR